jgi:cystathionine beta-lyase/cystathionine gamma-synthase
MARTGRITVEYVDMTDEAAVKAAAKGAELLWMETPVNPTWDVIDIRAMADIAHEAGAILGVDSTSASPVVTRPFEHGADIVCYSLTKFIGGHGTSIGGAVVDGRTQRADRIPLRPGSHGDSRGRALPRALPHLPGWLRQRLGLQHQP